MPKVITKREEEIICNQYLANWPIKKIVAYGNLSQTTVMAILRRNNIPLREGRRISKAQREEAVVLYAAGNPIKEIMRLCEIKSEQTIYRILREASVPIRAVEK